MKVKDAAQVHADVAHSMFQCLAIAECLKDASTPVRQTMPLALLASMLSYLHFSRLYQFEPGRMSIQIVARILIKALMAMPAPDFSLCLFLIPEQVQSEDQFKTLIVLSHYLETARFRQFWDEVSKNRNILDGVPGFDQAIQNYAIHVLSLTYQKVPRAVLAEVINLEGLSLDKFLECQVAKSGWALENPQVVILPRNEFNHPELKKNAGADSNPLEHVTRIFPILG